MELDEFTGENEMITYVQGVLEKIQQAKSKSEKDRHLINLTSYLITSAEEIVKERNYYEAAGRLYSAAYYLEEFHPKAAQEVYEKVNEYNIEYLHEKLREGAIRESANIALKIAKIFEKKLQNREKEVKYLTKAIGLIANQIEILQGVGTPRELASKFQTLAMLYKKLEDWESVVISAKSALEFAKMMQDYSIISNSYKMISNAYEKQEKPRKAENKLFEAIDYFSKEAVEYESNNDYLPLSQLYQIIKKLNQEIRNPRKYKIYSRKEAGVYVSMAKLSLLYESSDTQTAAYYRAAALCYQETGQNYLDGASCFLLAANYYENEGRLLEASLNYEDAAKCFEKIEKWRKAFENFFKAGRIAAQGSNLQTAIEDFMWAHDIAQEHKFKKQEVTELLYQTLTQLATVEKSVENYFVTATLYLEGLYYRVKANEITVEYIEDRLKEILDYYMEALNRKNLQKPSVKSYTYALACILSLTLKDEKVFKGCLKNLEEQQGKTSIRYLKLVNQVKDNLIKASIIEFGKFSERMRKLLDSSEEIKIALKIANKYHSLSE